jgi:hypothetical protein
MRSPPAGYLVHNLRCPVVVCRGRRQDREAKAPRKVMVSLDDSEASRKALEVRPLDVPLPCSRSRCAGGTCAPYHHM